MATKGSQGQILQGNRGISSESGMQGSKVRVPGFTSLPVEAIFYYWIECKNQLRKNSNVIVGKPHSLAKKFYSRFHCNIFDK